MKIDVYCTECQKKYLIDPQHEGRKVKCKSCGASFVAQAVAELETADIFEADIPRAPALELPVTRSSVPTARSPESPANSPTSQSVPAPGEISFTLLSTSLLQDPKGVTLHGRLKLSHIAAMYPKRKTTTMPSFATGGAMPVTGSGNFTPANDNSYPVSQQSSSTGGDPIAAAIGYGMLAAGMLGLIATRFIPALYILGWFQAPLFAMLVIVGCCFVMLGHSHQWSRGMLIAAFPGLLALIVLAFSAFTFVGGFGSRSAISLGGPSRSFERPSQWTTSDGRTRPRSSRRLQSESSRSREMPDAMQPADTQPQPSPFPPAGNNTVPGTFNPAGADVADFMAEDRNENEWGAKEIVERLEEKGFLPPSFPDQKTQTPKPKEETRTETQPGRGRNPFETNSEQQNRSTDSRDSAKQSSSLPMGENDFDDVELAENLLKFQSRHEFILAFHESQSLNQHLNTQLRREYGAFAFDRELAGWVGPGTSPRKSTATNAAKTPFVPIVGVKIIADLSGEHLTTLVPCYESDPVNTFQAPEGYVITGFRSTVQKYVTAIQFVCHRQTEQGIDLADSQSSAWFGTPQGEPVLYGGQHPIVGFWIDSSSLGMKSLGIFHQPQ